MLLFHVFHDSPASRLGMQRSEVDVTALGSAFRSIFSENDLQLLFT